MSLISTTKIGSTTGATPRLLWRLGQLDWFEQCFMSPTTQYRLYGRRFLQVKRPNQQYQSTEGTYSTQTNQTYNKQTYTDKTQQIP